MPVRASIDIGSNSVRLLVAEIERGTVRPLVRELRTTRLGSGLAGNGRLPDAAVRQTLQVLDVWREMLTAYPDTRPVVVATSAVREAANATSFLEAVRRATGWEVKVVTGAEEAALSYRGATSALGLAAAVVVDIGGGSTEIAFPGPNGLESQSFPVGAVRAAPPAETAGLLDPVLQRLQENNLPLVGVGGTFTTLAAMQHVLMVYDPDIVHGTVLRLAEIKRWEKELVGLSLEERRQLPGLQPQRADIIVAGTTIARTVVEGSGQQEITVSEADLLWALLEEPFR